MQTTIQLIQYFSKLRSYLGLTQGFVAKALNEITGKNHSRQTISAYEGGKSCISLERILQLLRCVGAITHIFIEDPLSPLFLKCKERLKQADFDKLLEEIEFSRKERIILLFPNIFDLELLFFSNYVNHYLGIELSQNQDAATFKLGDKEPLVFVFGK